MKRELKALQNIKIRYPESIESHEKRVESARNLNKPYVKLMESHEKRVEREESTYP